MNKPISTSYFTGLIFALTLFSSGLLKAEALIFKPIEPVVAIGQSIQLSVSGLINDIVWYVSEGEGQIESPTNRVVTYVAPNQEGHYWITVAGKESTGKILSDVINVTVLLQAECEEHPKCSNNPPNVKAAILIHSRTAEEYIYSLGLHIYQTLKARFYKDNEIYITPLNFTLADAFEKAKTQSQIAKAEGLAEEPLVVVFIGENPPENLSNLLDDYQATTSNQIIVIIEAPYSGQFIDTLESDNRMIITSTNNTNHNDFGVNAFSKFYFDQLRASVTYWEAWEFVKNIYTLSDDPQFNQQQPQLKDNLEGELAQTLSLNNFGELPGVILTIKNFLYDVQFINTPIVMPYQRVDFIAEISDARHIDALVAQPNSLELPIRLREGDDGIWHYSYLSFATQGNYPVIFKVTKNNDEIINTPAVSFLVITYPSVIGDRLYVPAVAVPNGEGGENIFQVELIKRSNSETFFELDSLKVFNGDISSVQIVKYNPVTGGVPFPLLDMPDVFGVNGNLQLIDPTPPMLFELRH
jgi:hypothetical protein